MTVETKTIAPTNHQTLPPALASMLAAAREKRAAEREAADHARICADRIKAADLQLAVVRDLRPDVFPFASVGKITMQRGNEYAEAKIELPGMRPIYTRWYYVIPDNVWRQSSGDNTDTDGLVWHIHGSKIGRNWFPDFADALLAAAEAEDGEQEDREMMPF